MANNIHTVILSGGAGSRLWPLSRKSSPKQFIPLLGENNLLQDACLRYKGNDQFQTLTVVSNEEHRFQVAESLRAIGINDAEIILEPFARDTAPAVALAALSLCEKFSDPLMFVVPSDHYMENLEEMFSILSSAHFENNALYTFGIKPRSPESAYGYIEAGEQCSRGIFSVKQFVEKPSVEKAQAYCDAGNFYWNSGFFLFKAKAYLDALKTLQPAVYAQCYKAFQQKTKDLDFIRVGVESFSQSPAISIDYAVMEKASNVKLIPLESLKWSDIGSWNALFDLSEKDESGNLIKGDVFQINTNNSYLRSQTRLLAAVGVDHLIVVETADAILVAHRDHDQDIKKLVSVLKKASRSEVVKNKRRYGPWGRSDCFIESEHFVINRLSYNANAKSSLQVHHHRSEHFVILRGLAKVVVDGVEHQLSQGMSVNVLPKQKHQIFAFGEEPLEILEIQYGEIISPEDVVRLGEN
ncbi:MAG: mannose-1-phosphate guanylyltransferase/mannose-6-phosphate isomerase [Gammaproteobacteria bacterium CG11_big_fil_rev_8_21_14_0_20_46_22]|nr:MAG: mannose-1-phosphate guanylyltransferase/mannose-6-phosphate isomerase [Gammaproteobacteria bacterium CG12_big_fil_rev_8_21_14_0_65_46_12]PIR10338.1 MAG: mannose-1-phosphate guanylyltransferase/mannose-6-phosphate isomerase [Gammaproteobacteria bacterium CG11_big_fil_rev_8_21_14_0_20_46_22]